MKHFLVAGDANVDIILSDLSGFPVLGQEVEATRLSTVLGGSCANCASWLSGLGAEVAFWGKVGQDSFGEFVTRELQARGVDVTGLIHDPEISTGICVALSAPDERALASYLGTVATLQLEELPLRNLVQYSHLHSGSIFLQHGLRPALVDLFRAAKEAGLSTSLDCGWDPYDRWDIDLAKLLEYVDIFLPNEAEALRLTNTQQSEDALQALGRHGHMIVIKRGKQGVIAQNNNQLYQLPALKIEQTETTGAGDCFNAGLLFKLYQQAKDFPEALQFAIECGAAGASGMGGSSMISPTLLRR